jgi:putative peptidoglycan lipid II flippase
MAGDEGSPTDAAGGAIQPEQSDRLTRRVGVVSAAVFVSRILGLVREQTFAVLFGAGRELDAFVTAFRIPNLLRDLLAEGALSAAFVTTFTQRFERESGESAWRLANLVVTMLTLLVSLLCLLGIWFAPTIATAIAPGFLAEPGKIELTARLTRIMTPYLLLVALAAIAMGILNSRHHFGIPAMASAFFNLGSVVGGIGCAWLLAPDYIVPAIRAVLYRTPPPPPDGATRAMMGMAIGTLIGGVLQLGVQLPSLHRVGYRLRPVIAPRDPGLRQILRLMMPAAVGAAAVQVNVFVNSNFASYLGDGPVSWLNVAFRFMQLPIGLFGVAIGVVALPALSRQVARNDHAALVRTLDRALTLLVILTVPAAAGLALFGGPIIGLVYQHGRFTAFDTVSAGNALSGYAIGLVGYAALKVITPAFYALDDVRTPALISLLSIAVNLGLNWLFVRKLGFGHVGLAVATSGVAIANCTLLAFVLRRRVGPYAPGLGRTTLRVLAATAVMCAAAAAADAAVRASGFSAYAVRVAAVLAAASPTFVLACVALRVPLPRRGQ